MLRPAHSLFASRPAALSLSLSLSRSLSPSRNAPTDSKLITYYTHLSISLPPSPSLSLCPSSCPPPPQSPPRYRFGKVMEDLYFHDYYMPLQEK